MISVAIVMPEIGFDDEPMRPVMRDDTVAKKKPKMMMRTATRKLPCVGRPGVDREEDAPAAASRRCTNVIGMSRSVRSCAPPAPRADALQAVARRGDDGRQRARQRDEPGRQHRAGADVADVGAPDLPRRHLRDEERLAGGRVVGEVGVDRRERHRNRRAEDRQQRQQHQPRQHAAGEHRAGDARADDVADAHVLGRDVDVERGVGKLAGARERVADFGAGTG